jgi:hypothetical protein
MRHTVKAATALIAVALAGNAAQANCPRPVTAEHIRLVSTWYQKYLGRDVDQLGLQCWTTALSKGGDAEAGILGSQEYYLRFGATPESFVFSLYINVLSREAAPNEVAGWVCRLQQLKCNRTALAAEFLRAAATEIALRAAPPPPPGYTPPPPCCSKKTSVPLRYLP